MIYASLRDLKWNWKEKGLGREIPSESEERDRRGQWRRKNKREREMKGAIFWSEHFCSFFFSESGLCRHVREAEVTKKLSESSQKTCRSIFQVQKIKMKQPVKEEKNGRLCRVLWPNPASPCVTWKLVAVLWRVAPRKIWITTAARVDSRLTTHSKQGKIL